MAFLGLFEKLIKSLESYILARIFYLHFKLNLPTTQFFRHNEVPVIKKLKIEFNSLTALLSVIGNGVNGPLKLFITTAEQNLRNSNIKKWLFIGVKLVLFRQRQDL